MASSGPPTGQVRSSEVHAVGIGTGKGGQAWQAVEITLWTPATCHKSPAPWQGFCQ